jgi:putative ABC transport system permease protein
MSRKLLAAFAVWVGISLILAFLAVSIDVGDKMNRELQAFGSNIRMEPVAASVPVRVGGHEVPSTAPPALLEERDLVTLKRIFWKNNILGVVPRFWTHGKAGGRDVTLLGVWFEHEIPVEGGEPHHGARRVYKHWKVAGAGPPVGLRGKTSPRLWGKVGPASLASVRETRYGLTSHPACHDRRAGIASTGGGKTTRSSSLAAAQALAGAKGKYSKPISAL